MLILARIILAAKAYNQNLLKFNRKKEETNTYGKFKQKVHKQMVKLKAQTHQVNVK